MKKAILIALLALISGANSFSILICDWYNHRIVKINDMAGTGWEAYGTHGGGIGQFDGPIGVAVGPDEKIYIADRGNHRVVRIENLSGEGWSTLDGFSWPRDITFDNLGRMYVTNELNNSITRVDDFSGAGRVSFGSSGSGVLQFNRPTGISVDNQRLIYIIDHYNNRLVRVNDMTGAGWTTFGTFGSGVGQLNEPLRVFIHPQERNEIYITDMGNNRIVRINDAWGGGWTTYGSFGSSAGFFHRPDAINYGSDGKLYIADSRNHRIVRIDDMTGVGWADYGTYGFGIGQFDWAVSLTATNLSFLDIEERPLPSEISLTAYPNPFNRAVTIEVEAPSDLGQITADIFDFLGRKIATIRNPEDDFGFDATEKNTTVQFKWSPDEAVNSGVYFIRANLSGKTSYYLRVIFIK